MCRRAPPAYPLFCIFAQRLSLAQMSVKQLRKKAPGRSEGGLCILDMLSKPAKIKLHQELRERIDRRRGRSFDPASPSPVLHTPSPAARAQLHEELLEETQSTSAAAPEAPQSTSAILMGSFSESPAEVAMCGSSDETWSLHYQSHSAPDGLSEEAFPLKEVWLDDADGEWRGWATIYDSGGCVTVPLECSWCDRMMQCSVNNDPKLWVYIA